MAVGVSHLVCLQAFVVRDRCAWHCQQLSAMYGGSVISLRHSLRHSLRRRGSLCPANLVHFDGSAIQHAMIGSERMRSDDKRC
jgi:hypothetical protein